MKITKEFLKKLIEEEASKMLDEVLPAAPAIASWAYAGGHGAWEAGKSIGKAYADGYDYVGHSKPAVSKGKGANPEKYKKTASLKHGKLFASDWADWPLEAQKRFCADNLGKPTVDDNGKKVPAPGPTCREIMQMNENHKNSRKNLKISNNDLVKLIEFKLNEYMAHMTTVDEQAELAMQKAGMSSEDFGIENLSKKLDIRLQSINSFAPSSQESGAVAGKTYDVGITLFVAPEGFDHGGLGYASLEDSGPSSQGTGYDSDEDGDITNDLNESKVRRLIEAELSKLLANKDV